MRDLSSRRIKVAEVATEQPSPFARSLLFGYVAAFMYEGDNPLAERRAAALSLDQGLLAELLGRAELRELLDPEVLAELEAELQRLTPDRQARDAEGVADLLRLLGPLSTDEVAARCTAERRRGRRLADRRCTTPAGSSRSGSPASSAGPRSRTSPGCATGSACRCHPGTPEAFTEPVADPLGRPGRPLRPHPRPVHQRRRRRPARARRRRRAADAASGSAAQGRVLEGEFRPAGAGSEWCDAEVLRRLRRRSLAALRKEVEPVEPATLGRFLPAWQHVRRPAGEAPRGLRGVDGVLTVVEQLAGCAVPASALEPLVLASRVADYAPAMLDELTATGEVLWAGHGTLPGTDGWVSLHLADSAHLTLPDHGVLDATPLHYAVLEALAGGGAYFFRQLSDAAGSTDDKALEQALWDLVWAGRLSNDTLAPLRALASGGRTAHRVPPPAPAGPGGRRRPAPRSCRAAPVRRRPPGGGRCCPTSRPTPTRRAHASAEALLERHGVVTRGAVSAERVPGGFAGVYKVLVRLRGLRPLPPRLLRRRARRRPVRGARRRRPAAVVLPRPRRAGRRRRTPGRHRVRASGADARWRWPRPTPPTRTAPPCPGPNARDAEDGATRRHRAPAGPQGRGARGAGRRRRSALYVERGGRTLLTFTDDVEVLTAGGRRAGGRRTPGGAGPAHRRAGRRRAHPRPPATRCARRCEEAGFVATPRGLRLRG